MLGKTIRPEANLGVELVHERGVVNQYKRGKRRTLLQHLLGKQNQVLDRGKKRCDSAAIESFQNRWQLGILSR